MRRRQILAGCTALLSGSFAGCALPSNSVRVQESTPLKIVGTVSMREKFMEPEEIDVLRTAVQTGTATRTTATYSGQDAWFDQRNTVLLNKTVYTVSETQLESEKETMYRVDIDFTPENTSSQLGKIRYDKLPPTDRNQLNRTLSDGISADDFDGIKSVAYKPAEVNYNKSVFIPKREYGILQYDGEQYRVSVEQDFIYYVEYEYKVTEIAASVKEFAEQLRNKYLFTLDGLSPAEQEVIEDAIETGEVAWESEDSASVIAKIREHTALEEDDYSGTWLMKYDGDEYLVYLIY